MGSSGNFLQVVAKNFDVLALYVSLVSLYKFNLYTFTLYKHLHFFFLLMLQASSHSCFSTVSSMCFICILLSKMHVYTCLYMCMTVCVSMYIFLRCCFYRYASIRAIETKSRTDDQQWLTYWVLYSMLTLFELTFAKVLEL